MLLRRTTKGRAYRHVKHDKVERIGGNFYRAWYHPTKGKRRQRISVKEAMLTLMAKAQRRAQTKVPDAIAA